MEFVDDAANFRIVIQSDWLFWIDSILLLDVKENSFLELFDLRLVAYHIVYCNTSLARILKFSHHSLVSSKIAVSFLVNNYRAFTSKLKNARD